MALEYFDNRNKRTDVPLHFEYSMEQLTNYYNTLGFDRRISGSSGSNNWWKITRRATKTYTYVGLSRDAAQRCAMAKKRMYTRPFAYWGQLGTRYCMRYGGKFTTATHVNFLRADKYLEPVAEINITRGDGELYTVQITVDESVCIYKVLGSLQTLPDDRTLGQWFSDKTLSGAPGFTYDE